MSCWLMLVLALLALLACAEVFAGVQEGCVYIYIYIYVCRCTCALACVLIQMHSARYKLRVEFSFEPSTLRQSLPSLFGAEAVCECPTTGVCERERERGREGVLLILQTDTHTHTHTHTHTTTHTHTHTHTHLCGIHRISESLQQHVD